MKRVSKSIFIVGLFICPIFFAIAHGTGKTLEKTAGEYNIDLDYDNPELVAGESVRFNFNIWSDKDRTSAPEWTDVWVRISPAGSPGIVYAGDVHRPSFGSAGFTFVFPRSGSYEISVRYQNNDKTLTDDVTFPLTVLEGDSVTSSNGWLNAIIGGIVGLFLGMTLKSVFNKRMKM